jgi:hypothetical protein
MKSMSRQSSITVDCGGVHYGSCGAGFGIRKLESVAMQLKKRLVVIASGSAQKPSPKRRQMLPSRAQLMMLVLCDVAELAQAQLRYNAGDVFGHREQGSGDAGVESGDVPGDKQRIAHQFDGEPAREHADRSERTSVPRGFTLRSLPPWRIPELDIREEKRAATRAPLSRRIQRSPKGSVGAHYLGRGVLAVFSRRLRHELDVSFVELVDELEAWAARPRGNRN